VGEKATDKGRTEGNTIRPLEESESEKVRSLAPRGQPADGINGRTGGTGPQSKELTLLKKGPEGAFAVSFGVVGQTWQVTTKRSAGSGGAGKREVTKRENAIH